MEIDCPLRVVTSFITHPTRISSRCAIIHPIGLRPCHQYMGTKRNHRPEKEEKLLCFLKSIHPHWKDQGLWFQHSLAMLKTRGHGGGTSYYAVLVC